MGPVAPVPARKRSQRQLACRASEWVDVSLVDVRTPLQRLVRTGAGQLWASGVPELRVGVPKFPSAGSVQTSQFSRRVDGASGAATLSRAWPMWPDFEDLMTVLRDDPVLMKILAAQQGGDTAQGTDVVSAVTSWVVDFMTDYLSRLEIAGGAWQPDTFDEVFGGLEECVATGKMRGTEYASLVGGWGPDITAQELVDGVVLKQPSDDERIALQPQPRFLGHTAAPPSTQLYLTRAYESALDAPVFYGASMSAFVRCAAAMRVVCGGTARVATVQMLRAPGTPLAFRSFGWSSPGPEAQYWSGVVTEVKPADIDAIRSVAAELSRVESAFPVTMSRFNTAASRGAPEDRLIDYTIALESVLLPDVRDELSFRFQMRGAWLLGSDGRQRRVWGERLREIYEARSAIVHGGSRRSKRTDNELVDDAAEALRLLLQRFIGGPHDRRSWKRLLDEVVVGDGEVAGKELTR